MSKELRNQFEKEKGMYFAHCPTVYFEWLEQQNNELKEKNGKYTSIEDKNLPKDRPFISKSSNNNELICLCRWNSSTKKINPIINSIHHSNIGVKNITHWKEV